MQYTTAEGLSLNVLESGVGPGGAGAGRPALVFLHYFGGSARTWGPVAARLAADFPCFRLDGRGWGDSDKPDSGYAVDDMADDAAAVIAALGLSRYVLVGHSMGGKAAQSLAARRPAGLERLLLVGPSPLSPEPMSEDNRAQMRAAWGDRDASRRTLETISRLPLSPEWRQQVVEDALRAGRAAWESWADLGSLEDLSALAQDIAVPAAVLAGERDPVLPPDVLAREVVERILGATLTILPGAGHLMPLEAPDAVADWIRMQIAA